ncbi:GntR family transcriptional regulator [Streptomyces sp. G-G2]|uniref:GntR family transcriptional regulator n=1 Tax=Streptomyces sp. G-G2 TaxID=3046201 RepID=UPI0024B986B9|nr:GntR family transcriptional regulator [Streptomyces sp. G-G2]MDJ0384353.1 GntR family transcriptional regulator [Streptomyces sp. G-G2]
MTLPSPEEPPFDPRPLHVRIAADLRDEVMNGELAPGARLPSTILLKARFDASSATIQKALGLLKDEGLVVGRAGSAVTVREHRQRTIRPAASLALAAADEPYPWLADAAGPGAHAVSTFVEVREVAPPADVATALGLQEGDLAVLRQQVMRIDGEPAELVRSYYPSEIARGTALAEARKIKGGTPALLAGLGFPPRLGVDRVSARVPTQEEYRALGLPGDLPVLRTLRTVFSDDRRPVEVTVMVKSGHLYELRYEFPPS